MPDKKLSIIVVNFRSAQVLLECLSSVQEKIVSRKKAEIIIVNNDVDENLAGIMEKAVVINNPKNVGYGQACNIGAEKAQGQVLLFLNPDTKILSDNIDEIMDFLEKDKAVIVGAGLVEENGRAQKWCAGKKVNIWNLAKNNFGLSGDKKITGAKDALAVDWVSGAAMFVRKDVFQKMGGFDQGFFMYFEDVDLCQRVKNAGYKVVYCPLFRVLHRGGESHDNRAKQKSNYYDSQEYYFKKHCGFFQTALLRLLKKIIM